MGRARLVGEVWDCLRLSTNQWWSKQLYIKKKAWLWFYGYFRADDLQLQLQNPNISTMFALLFMLFTTIIAPLIPTLSSQSPPCPPFPPLTPPLPFPPFPSLTPPPPAPAFQFPPIPPFRPFTSSRPPPKPPLPPDNIWPPSQPQPVSVLLVLGSILALTTLTGILAMMIYHRQRNQPQVEAVPTAPPHPIEKETTPEVSDSPKRVDPCNCARMEPRNCVLDHIVIYDVWWR